MPMCLQAEWQPKWLHATLSGLSQETARVMRRKGTRGNTEQRAHTHAPPICHQVSLSRIL